MNGEYKELVDFLGTKFDRIDVKFEEVGGQLSELRQDIGEKLDRKADKSDVANILNNLDAYSKRTDDAIQETAMLSSQVDRHETWIQHLAQKLGLKLEY